MPTFFEARLPDSPAPMIEADGVASRMNDAVAHLGVRILALRRVTGGGVLFGAAARRSLTLGALVARLRATPKLAGVEIGDESERPLDESQG
jgi:hypothetical protein